MKKLEIYTNDDVITLSSDYGMIGDEAAHELNSAEGDMFVQIRFSTGCVVMKKSDIRFIVESEVKDA